MMPGAIGLGDDLLLDPVRREDAAELYAAIDRNRAHLRRWLPWVHAEYSPTSAEGFLAERVREHESGTGLTMAIRESGRICGVIGLHTFNAMHRSSSLGYWLDAGAEGRGIMTRACAAVVREGFETNRLHRIEIRCATGNERSCAIPRRLGFLEEGLLREAEWLYDHWVDLRVFSKLASDAG